jgi:hypothetical protein
MPAGGGWKTQPNQSDGVRTGGFLEGVSPRPSPRRSASAGRACIGSLKSALKAPARAKQLSGTGAGELLGISLLFAFSRDSHHSRRVHCTRRDHTPDGDIRRHQTPGEDVHGPQIPDGTHGDQIPDVDIHGVQSHDGTRHDHTHHLDHHSLDGMGKQRRSIKQRRSMLWVPCRAPRVS